MTLAQPQRIVHYPDSDGKPTAEAPEHLEAMIYLITALQAYFAEREDVYVGGNQFLYWIEGNPRQRVAPDVYVVFGVPKRPPRPTWQVWAEGKAPDVIFELTSRSTAGEDLDRKYRLYQRLGVQEYILIDVTRQYLIEPMLLYRLQGNEYHQVPNERPNDREWRVTSELLGLQVVVRAEDEGYLVRLWDPAQQRFLPSIREATEEMLRVYQQMEQMRRREAEAQRRAEEEARRAQEQARRAEEEARRAEEEARRAQEEARRRAELEARLREMEEELRRLKGDAQRTDG